MIPCPRLTHNIRLAVDGNIQVCGHMITAPSFVSFDHLQHSEWRQNAIELFEQGQFPAECKRCQQIEEIGGTSIRQHSLKAHSTYSKINSTYIMVTGVMDNVCNSACLTCSKENSTYIGKLNNDVIIINNEEIFFKLNLKDILVFELAGGEPSVSKSYKRALNSLTGATKYVRINTNGLQFMPEVTSLLDKGIEVTITLSIDGLDKVFEYIRWPISWKTFTDTQSQYIELTKQYTNLNLNYWMTVSALNIHDIENVMRYSNMTGIPMSYALLDYPSELNIKYKNKLTLKAKEILAQSDNPELNKLLELVAVDRDNTDEFNKFIATQHAIRSINFYEYY